MALTSPARMALMLLALASAGLVEAQTTNLHYFLADLDVPSQSEPDFRTKSCAYTCTKMGKKCAEERIKQPNQLLEVWNLLSFVCPVVLACV